MFHEHHYRSILKAITWFVLAFLITFLILGFLNKNWTTSFVEALTVQALKALVYYLHERLWNKSDYGQRLKKPVIVMK